MRPAALLLVIPALAFAPRPAARAEGVTTASPVRTLPAPVTQAPVIEGWAPGLLPEGAPPATAAPIARRRPLSPLAADLAAVTERHAERMAALLAELAKAADATQALALQRRVEQDKKDTELEMLRVQLAHARRAGSAALAGRLEAAIAEQLQPPSRLQPAERPAPSRDDAR